MKLKSSTNLFLSIFFLGVSNLLVACGDGGRLNTYDDSALVGRWENACWKMTTPHAAFVRNRMTFGADGSYKNEMMHFADNQCITFVSINTQFSSGGVYRLGKSLTTTDGLQARELDIYTHTDEHDKSLDYNDRLYTIYSYTNNNLGLYLWASEFNTNTRPLKLNFDVLWNKVP